MLPFGDDTHPELLGTVLIANTGAPNRGEASDSGGLRDYEVRVLDPDGQVVFTTGTVHRRRDGWVALVGDAFAVARGKFRPRDGRR